MKASCAILCLLAGLGVGGAADASVGAEKLPNPMTSYVACGNSGPSVVCDPDLVLNPDERASLNAFARQSGKGFKVDCEASPGAGAEIAVAIVREMDVREGLSWSEDRSIMLETEAYARGAHDRWRVGDSACQNGVLIFVSLRDRSMYVSHGAGFDSLLPRVRIESVIREAGARFREGDIFGGLRTAILQLDLATNQGAPTSLERLSEYGYWLGDSVAYFLELVLPLLFIGAMFAVASLSACQGIRRRRLRKEFRSAQLVLSKLEKERAEARAGRYQCTSCPICLEDFQRIKGQPRRPEPPAAGQAPQDEGEDEETIGSDGRPVVLLHCGHQFDHSCFMEYLSREDGEPRCPICRAAIGRGAGDADQGSASEMPRRNLHQRRNGTSDQQYYVRPSNFGTFRRHSSFTDPSRHYDEELRFRLRSLRRRHSAVVTEDLVERWGTHDFVGPMATDEQFLANDVPAAPPAREAGDAAERRGDGGYGGGVSSFGGGSSSGGRGGRW